MDREKIFANHVSNGGYYLKYIRNSQNSIARRDKKAFFSISGQGIDLDYRDIEWFALERNRDHSVVVFFFFFFLFYF